MINLKTGKEMTRGGFLKCILASGIAPSITLGALANAGAAKASVGGMMRNVGARNAAMFGGGKPTAKDYVQDGLYCLWDGIENNGYGKHSSSLESWKNLIGNYCNLKRASGDMSFGNDYYDMSSYDHWAIDYLGTDYVGKSVSIEIVFEDIFHLYTGEVAILAGSQSKGHYNSYSIAMNYNGLKFLTYPATAQIDKTTSIYSLTLTYDYSIRLAKLFVNGEFNSSSNQSPYSLGDSFSIGGNAVCNDRVTGKYKCVRLYIGNALKEGDIEKNNKVDKARFNLT